MKWFKALIAALPFAVSVSYSASSWRLLESSTWKRSSYCGLGGGYMGFSRCMNAKGDVCQLNDCDGGISNPYVSVTFADSAPRSLTYSASATKSRHGTLLGHFARGQRFSWHFACALRSKYGISLGHNARGQSFSWYSLCAVKPKHGTEGDQCARGQCFSW